MEKKVNAYWIENNRWKHKVFKTQREALMFVKKKGTYYMITDENGKVIS